MLNDLSNAIATAQADLAQAQKSIQQILERTALIRDYIHQLAEENDFATGNVVAARLGAFYTLQSEQRAALDANMEAMGVFAHSKATAEMYAVQLKEVNRMVRDFGINLPN